MDKKNTLLLTVIAVATLLVAVVGATFAYFSVVGNQNSSTTTVTGKTPKAGLLSLTTTQANLYLKPTADNFSEANSKIDANTKLYAVTSDAGIPVTTPQNTEIAKLSLTDSEEGASYSCDATLKISFEEEALAAAVKEEDAYLRITAPSSTGFDDVDETGTYDLTGETGLSLKTIYDHKDDVFNNAQVGFSLTQGETDNIKVSADLWLVNTKDIQNDSVTSAGVNNISGKDLKMKIEITGLECNAVPSA